MWPDSTNAGTLARLPWHSTSTAGNFHYHRSTSSVPHCQLFRRQVGHTGKTYSVTTWGARHQQQRQQHHHQQQQQQHQQQWWRRRWRRQRRGLHESFICASAAAAATAVGLAGVGRIRDEQRAAWLASLRSRPHPHSIFGRPSGRPQRFVHVPDFKSWGPIYKISYNLSYDYRGARADPLVGIRGRSPPPRKLTAYYGYLAAKLCTILCI